MMNAIDARCILTNDDVWILAPQIYRQPGNRARFSCCHLLHWHGNYINCASARFKKRDKKTSPPPPPALPQARTAIRFERLPVETTPFYCCKLPIRQTIANWKFFLVARKQRGPLGNCGLIGASCWKHDMLESPYIVNSKRKV